MTKTRKDHELVLLTGESGSGKTSWCLELIHASRAAGIEPLGLVSPAVFENGVKTGIDLVNIASSERRRLAVSREHVLPGSPIRTGLVMRNWLFDTEVLTWGNQILAGLHLPGELIILDELGPLEFLENKGLVEGMKFLGGRVYNLACVAVRPSLLSIAQEHWPWARVLHTIAGKMGQAEQL